jgi:DNA polymerase I
MIKNLKTEYADSRLIFFFDTCRSDMKMKLYPEYKANRKNKLDEKEYERFKNILNEIIALMKSSGLIVIDGDGYEADDYIAAITKMLQTSYKIVIVSTDKDLCLLLNENARIYDPIKQISITDENFKNIMGIELKYYIDYKCMVGDTSDNITGIEGIGEITAKKLINEYGNFYAIATALTKKEKRLKKEDKLLQSIDIFERNKQLMDLSFFFTEENIKKLIKEKSRQISLDKDKLLDILARNEATEFMNDVVGLCLVKS